MKIKTTKDFNPVRLIVDAGARYPEDATVNGVEDSDGVLMPLMTEGRWKPTIELETGRVLNWPQGTTADIHYKVCDDGDYWLEDSEGNRVKWNGSYVPDSLLAVGDHGYGDYIILKISSDGLIEGWKKPTLHDEDWELK